MPRKASAANSDLIEEVEGLCGELVTPRQLERWRQAGLLPSPHRVGLGRGAGSTSAYLGGTAQLVCSLLTVLKDRRSLSEAPLRQFARGLPVHVPGLKKALVELVQSSAVPESEEESALDTAEQKAAAVLRSRDPRRKAMLARLREARGDLDPEQRESPSEVLLSVITNTLRVLSGQVPDAEQWEEIASAWGLSALSQESWEGVGPLAEDTSISVVEEVLTSLDVENQAEVVERASLTELEDARDQYVGVIRCLTVFGSLLQRATGLPEGLGLAPFEQANIDDELVQAQGAVGWLILKDHIPSEVRAALAEVCNPVLEALDAGLDPSRIDTGEFLGEFLRILRDTATN